jgi:hypothetical protein
MLPLAAIFAVRVGTKILVRRSVLDRWLETHQAKHIDLGLYRRRNGRRSTRDELMGVKIKKRGRKWHALRETTTANVAGLCAFRMQEIDRTVTKPTNRQLDITESIVFPS